MLEGRCIFSRAFSSGCESEANWPFMTYHKLEITTGGVKRSLEMDGGSGGGGGDSIDNVRHRKKKASSSSKQLDYREQPISTVLASVSLSSNPNPNECSSNNSSSSLSFSSSSSSSPPSDASSDSLINPIGREISISCLIRCSRSEYGLIASLNRGFRSLVRSGDLYKLRRLNGVIEHWIYFACDLLDWEAFDPIKRRWMHLPRMTSHECSFMWSDKESLAVGTELLVFGKEVTSHVIYAYSILTNSWTSGMRMNAPRCLFGSASLGEKAILAGGCDSQGTILDSAELYNSETKSWETLPPMKKPRKMCSGVFMDEKFYVIGGIGGPDSKVLSCGEEYDLVTREWTEIPNMSPARNGSSGDNEGQGQGQGQGQAAAAAAPPLVAVVNNELYAADYAESEVRKYDKGRRVWVTVGRLPERAGSMNGWGLAFKACGDQLIVIGGPRALAEGFIELNSWKPSDGPPQWNLLARKQSVNFVYNCAVMGC